MPAASFAAAAQAIDWGERHGALDLGALRLKLVLEEGPCARLDVLRLDLSNIGASYEGRFASGRIEGTFARRAAAPRARHDSPDGRGRL